ncbi:MAG: Calx-beta domain-containing protein [Methylococcales bacterium]|nr:Calx-beta domain-containing protein [Methylococcales bacterium]
MPVPVVSSSSIVVDESTGFTEFVVRLSSPSTQTVSVQYYTSSGSASSLSDYDVVNTTTLSFAPGETTKTVRVGLEDDTTIENNESFSLKLINPTNADIGTGNVTATIVDDDGAPGTPVIGVSDTVVDETSGEAVFVISLDRPSTSAVSVAYTTASDTASTGDFAAVSGTAAFAPGEMVKTVRVAITGDTLAEGAERFNLVLSNPAGATLPDISGSALIGVSDQPSVITPVVSAENIIAEEGAGFAEFVVRLSAPSTQTVSVQYYTSSGSASSLSDYDVVNTTTLSFSPGETTKTVRVGLEDDTTTENNESFSLKLINPTNADIGTGNVTATIVDDDGAPPPVTYTIDPPNATVIEDVGTVTFTVTRSNGSTAQTVYASTVQNHGATNASDYTGLTNQAVAFAIGELSQLVTVASTNDTVAEGDETFGLIVQTAPSDPIDIFLATASFTIQDNDGATPPPRIAQTSGEIFRSEGEVENVGTIRVMADFSKAAYALQSWEVVRGNRVINDDSPNADSAYAEVTGQGWEPLNLTPSPSLSNSSTIAGQTVTNSVTMTNGYFTNGNAAAFVAHSADAVVISFRGTNDNGDDNPLDPGNNIHPDKDQWGSPIDGSNQNMSDHYALLQPLITAIDNYVADSSNGISKIYVTGHSLGGAMAIQYMGTHSGPEYSAVTFAAPGYATTNYPDRDRVTHIEINGDLTPDLGAHGGRTIHFQGDDDTWYSKGANHSMDYYRQITQSVDPAAWTTILAQAGDPEVFLGARIIGTNFIVDGLLSGTNTPTPVDAGNNILTDILGHDYDVYYGGRGNDTLTGGSDSELLYGGADSDTLSGGPGTDTAVYSGNYLAYGLKGTVSNLTVSGPDGSDTLSNIERLEFSDKKLAFDLDGSAGYTTKLLGVLFAPASVQNETYVGIGLQFFDAGKSYAEVADFALHAALGSSPSNEDLVRLLYTNVAGSAPDEATTNSYVNLIITGQFTQDSLTIFAADHELNLANINLLGLTQTGIEFV